MYDAIIIGGGAAGFFTAINLKEKNKKLKVAILERGKDFLTKVKISGGGRCNVTNSIFDPKELSKNYPRGEKQLLGPFHTFGCQDTMDWFKKRGVAIKIEKDGRAFPISNQSQTIIDCFFYLIEKYQIELLTNQAVKTIKPIDDYWSIETTSGGFETKNVVMATGSNPKIWEMLSQMGHQIVPAVPSLFTFNIKDKNLTELMGIAMPAQVKVEGTKLNSEGPILITHWGLSGPAILKLSAWGARILHEKNYQFQIKVNWTSLSELEVLETLQKYKSEHPKQQINNALLFGFSKRFWQYLLNCAEINENEQWANLSNKKLNTLQQVISQKIYDVNGKSTFKEEFVTAGGVELSEVNFKTMQSKIFKNLYFAGEILNIDAITGGFNFQNAWTGGWLISEVFKN